MPSKRQILLDYLYQTLLPTIQEVNGYTNTIALVERGWRDVNDLTDDKFPCLFLVGSDENRINLNRTVFNGSLEVDIVGAVKSTTGVTGVQAIMDAFIADTAKAILTDHTQGGRCSATELRRIITDDSDIEGIVQFAMQVFFQYQSEGTNQ